MKRKSISSTILSLFRLVSFSDRLGFPAEIFSRTNFSPEQFARTQRVFSSDWTQMHRRVDSSFFLSADVTLRQLPLINILLFCSVLFCPNVELQLFLSTKIGQEMMLSSPMLSSTSGNSRRPYYSRSPPIAKRLKTADFVDPYERFYGNDYDSCRPYTSICVKNLHPKLSDAGRSIARSKVR